MSDDRKNMTSQDDFWDLSDLVPRRKAAPQRREPQQVEATELHLTPRPVSGAVLDVPLTERHLAPVVPPPKPERTYTPSGALLREVRIYPCKNEYNYYEPFRHLAEKLMGKEGTPCPHVPFSSYMPQYTQMDRGQLAYYFWWRSSFRRGEALPADYAYLLLYVYELINLDAAHLDPAVGQAQLLRLWLSYRKAHPRLDPLLREWICDYSLLHALPPPRLDPRQYRTLLQGCRLKEFYVSAADGIGALGVAMLQFCNNYDYTKSKFYNDDTKAEYDRVLGGAIDVALRHLQAESGKGLTDVSGISTVSRDSFAGALCSWQLRRRIEVDYTSFSHTHELRYIMTDVLKYAENALRQNRGIKSRLSIYALAVPLRNALDLYLASALPPRRRSAATAPVPEYERRYELPVVEISPARAAEIEASSWQTTKRLIEAFGEGDAAQNATIPPETGAKNSDFEEIAPRIAPPAPPPSASPLAPPAAAPAAPQAAPASGFVAALGALAAFLPLAKAEDRAAQRAFADANGMMADAIADRINTLAADFIGDILLEERNGCYAVIPDYLEFLEEEGAL